MNCYRGTEPCGEAVKWNEFNQVVQCHRCGRVYSPKRVPLTATFEFGSASDLRAGATVAQMGEVKCFLTTKLDLAQRSLRRYVSGSTCPGPMGYHDASVVIVDAEPFNSPRNGSGGIIHPADDPRWPQVCSCGYVFADDDVRQCRLERLWENPETGQRFTLQHGNAPAGAMFYSNWHGDGKDHLQVITPGGQWDIDGPANNGPGWVRTGEPPNVTATPSILIQGSYHGWLRNGALVEC